LLIEPYDTSEDASFQDPEKIAQIIPTTLFVLAIATLLLGVMLIILGRVKLASIVQYLPMPVIGGEFDGGRALVW